jgi:glycine/betaine/sarcosine/D-proline reductase family selenoprotein B
VIAREIEKEGVPVALITAMTMVAKQMGANRIVNGTKIPHPCGDPNFSLGNDKTLRQEIVKCALYALQTDVTGPTVFMPNISYTSR